MFGLPFACFSRILAASSSFLRANAVPDNELPLFYIRGKETLTNVAVLKSERGNSSPAWPVCQGSFDGRDLFGCRESFSLCLDWIYIYDLMISCDEDVGPGIQRYSGNLRGGTANALQLTMWSKRTDWVMPRFEPHKTTQARDENWVGLANQGPIQRLVEEPASNNSLVPLLYRWIATDTPVLRQSFPGPYYTITIERGITQVSSRLGSSYLFPLPLRFPKSSVFLLRRHTTQSTYAETAR